MEPWSNDTPGPTTMVPASITAAVAAKAAAANQNDENEADED